MDARKQELSHLIWYLNLGGALREILYGVGPVANLVLFCILVYALNREITLGQVFGVIV